jgi:hypothetical protein
MNNTQLIDSFLAGTVDPDSFDHDAHIKTASSLLRNYEFLEAAYLYDKGIRQIAKSAGAEDKRSVTMTLAFLSLIAEGKTPARNALNTWYSQARLDDPVARQQFVLPDQFSP